MRRTLTTLVFAGALLAATAGTPASAGPPSTHAGCPPNYVLTANEDFFGPNVPKTADNVNRDGFVCVKSVGPVSIYIDNLHP